MKARDIIISASILMTLACNNKTEKTETTGSDKPEVKIEKVASEIIPQDETYTATVESDIKNNLSPNTPYRIERIYADVGDHVSKGQVLVQLDASNLRQLKLQIDNLRVEFNRTDQLYKVGGASKAEWDNAKTQLDVQQTLYKQLQENTQLRSPISGVVTARNYDDGDMYSTGNPVLTIEKLNPVKLIINVSETHYKDIDRGMHVDVKLDAYPEDMFAGKVSIIYPSVDSDTHTFPVEVIIDNSSAKVRPGMFARATIDYGSESHVMVPDEAIVKQIGAGDRYVYVYKNGKVSYNKVELGKHIGTKYEIFSGVNEGDEVVVAGMSRLANGIEVNVVK